ncbi:rhodanese-like domain-containing protein [Desulfobotulus sp. H1]|uniref:Rhodanese-like domain-containing protein n=1 Tax=Desulfobotulus pelophilus TaxID=2823377 RepID=A0ABT3N5S7_9BACT|nr:rhodanese-like domain-containing protein [Desulfobotulus pelophilus]MCW7752809.1 rhodanese-like domain-containing protein [Desulfobotulus pelophilus]
MKTEAFERMWPEDVATYMKARKEKAYLLVDVREDSEYGEEHIPGALHLPLSEVPSRIASFVKDAERELIFYCARGVRSEAAAIMGREVLGPELRIISMTGGMAAWESGIVESPPDLSLFYGNLMEGTHLQRAMALEKGAEFFYGLLAERWGQFPLGDVFAKMGRDEVAHARILWRFMREEGSFEAVYGNLTTDFAESGERLNDLAEQLEAFTGAACAEVLETALRVELMAYDLYRNLGESAQGEERDAFMTLAQAEKAHMVRLGDAFALCEESR